MDLQWEYCGFTGTQVYFYTSIGAKGRLLDPNVALYQLGAAGWELVAIHNGMLYFKRPVQPGRRIDDTFE